MWNIEPDSYPELASSPEKITEYVSGSIKPGSIILLHVMYDNEERESPESVKDIVAALQEKGYRFVTVSELPESFKDSKHRGDLFRFMDLTRESESNPVYKAIWDADRDFNYTEAMLVYKFFFSFMPIINFAAYFDDCKKQSSLNDRVLRSSFLRSVWVINSSFISGNDILMLDAYKE